MERRKPQRVPSTDQLRSAIDRGATDEKVAHPDPAAAPLGSDAEAASAPPSREERNRAFAAEVGLPDGHVHKPRALLLFLGFAGIIAAAAVLTFLIFVP